jgi:WD40 repeat protein
VAFSPDGKTLAFASQDETIRLWDVATWKERDPLKGHIGPGNSVAFSPDGKTLASASQDETIRLWDVATWKERATLKGHIGPVLSVVFSPDGKTLASAGYEPTVRLWDVATGQQLAALKGHTTGLVWSVVFSPDGKTLASAGYDQTVRLWPAATAREVFDYSRRQADTAPMDTKVQTELALACWELYLHLDLKNEEERSRGRRLLQQGQDILRRLQEKSQLRGEQETWISKFEAALK